MEIIGTYFRDYDNLYIVFTFIRGIAKRNGVSESIIPKFELTDETCSFTSYTFNQI